MSARAVTPPLPRMYRAAPWAEGPARVYDRLAAELLARSPLPLRGALVLDAGAGTGAVSSVAAAAGARVLATDVALDMLRHRRDARPPALAADVLALPLRDGCVDVAATAFVLNHLADPAAALSELGRVVRPGGCVLAATFASRSDDTLKRRVDGVLAAYGYRAPAWYRRLKDELEPATARPALLAAVAAAAGVGIPLVEEVEVALDMLDASALAGFRLGAPAVAAFLDTLDTDRRNELRAEASRAAETARPYSARMLVLAITVAA